MIPCYNQAYFLSEAIESALSQSYPNFEIIVVDDGSTDDTSEVASRYQKVRIVRQDNQGLPGARNAGLAESTGEYVVFLDADDRLLPEALEVGVRELEAHPECAFVSGRCDNVAADGRPLPAPPRLHVEGDHYQALLRRCYIWPPGVVMYRRAVFECVGGFDPSYRSAEDYEMYLRIARRFPVCNHKKVVVEYRRYATSMTSDRARMLSYSVGALRAQRQHIKGNEQYTEAYKAGVNRRRWVQGYRLIEGIRAHIRQREWGEVFSDALVLARNYPRGLALLLVNKQHIERRRLTRRLHALVQSLKVYEQRLKDLADTQKELRSTSAKERQEVQQLKGRIQRLERRMQNLDQRAQNVPNDKV